MLDVCIIGAGAAGLTAAVTAKELNPNLDLLILEKKDVPGKKILASGNGRCNLSNKKISGYEDTLDFFRDLGIMTKTDREGRIYPYTEEAAVVVRAFTKRLAEQGTEIKCCITVEKVEYSDKVFTIKTDKGNYEAKKLLIATGGKSSPKLGTTGDGFIWARELGHTVNTLIPSLTAIDVKEDFTSFAGIRAKALVILKHNKKHIFEEEGEVQFTKDGLSGVCIFNMSRHLAIPEGKTLADGFDDYEIIINFFPSEKNLEMILRDRIEEGFSGEDILMSIVRKPIAEVISKAAGDDEVKLAKELRSFTVHPKAVKGWDFAQVTKGGVSLDEINQNTMESTIIPGLFFAGEVTDFDGPCGGYNLENAWEGGIAAGNKLGEIKKHV